MIFFLKKRWVYHTLSWVFGILLIEFIAQIPLEHNNFWSNLGKSLPIILPFIPITYLNFYLKAKFYDNRKYLQYFLLLPIQITLGVLYFRLSFHFGKELGFNQRLGQDFANVFFGILLTTGIQYFKRGIINQYQLQELKAKNAEIELNMLKRQLNPHFLFNTINNICGVNQIDSERGTDMLMELAEVFRYHLKFSKAKFTLLSEEIELLKAYANLELLRLTDSCSVNLSFPDHTEDIKVPPLILLTFFENALKHGAHPSKPSFVNLNLTVSNRKIYFEVENSVHKNLNPVSTKIGLDNAKKRLDLLYPNGYDLDMTKTANTYKITLVL